MCKMQSLSFCFQMNRINRMMNFVLKLRGQQAECFFLPAATSCITMANSTRPRRQLDTDKTLICIIFFNSFLLFSYPRFCTAVLCQNKCENEKVADLSGGLTWKFACQEKQTIPEFRYPTIFKFEIPALSFKSP